MKYSEIKKRIEGNDKLREQLELVYGCFVKHGMRVPLEAAEEKLDVAAAKSFGLIEDETYSDRWRIEEGNLFAYFLLQKNIPDINENIPESLKSLEEVYEKATEKTQSHTIIRFSELGQRILELLLRLINENSSESFCDWITQLNNNPSSRMDYVFVEAYCAIADELAITSEEIIDACRQFLGWMNMSAETAVMPLLRRYAAQNWEKGKAIFESLSDDDRSIKNGLLSGLLKNNYEKGWPLAEDMFQSSGSQAYVMNAVPHLPITSPEIGERVLDLILSCDRANELNQINLPFTLARLLNVVECNDSVFIGRCYNEFNEMSKIENIQIFQTVLNALWLCAKKNPPQLTQTLKILLVNPVITHENIGKLNYNPSFDSILRQVEDIELIFNFFEEYAKLFANEFTHETFYETITTRGLHSETPEPFKKNVINCLIHDEGPIRLFGNRILDFYSHYNHKFEFHTDIAQLPPISQYKLWMSVLSPLKQPKYTVPLLLPLLNSKEPIVAEAFLCKLEELTECFHEEVIHQVEQGVIMTHDREKSYVTSALERLKSHYAKFCRQLEEKNQHGEFHPIICQTSAFNRFNELYSSKMKENLDMALKKSGGLISLLPKVELAKGGGWKMGEQNEIRKLGHVQTSFVVPRFYLINPEKFEWELQMEFSTSWYSEKTDFIEWITE